MSEFEIVVGTEVPKGLSASQWASIRLLRANEDTPVPTTEDRRPATIYTSAERFALEQDALFRRLPLVVAPGALLPETNMSVALEAYGLPLIVTRDRAGMAHTFVNACRHKGAQLLEACEPAKTGRITCPYHAWSYAMDGALVGVPRQETFPTLDKSSLGLVELPTFEGGGLVWLGLDRDRCLEKLEGTGQLVEDFEAFGLQDMFVYGRRQYDLKANWKAVMEPFLEPYHIHRLHADSIADMFVDGPNVNTHFGHFLRQTSGKAGFDPAVLQSGVRNIHKYITHAYLVFPNTVLITSPYYMSLMILIPRAADRTQVQYYMLLPEEPVSEKAKDIAQRSYSVIHEVFGGEDFRAAELSQAGLATGAIEQVYYGGLEEMIGPFHRSIESFLNPGAE